jgi:hypothetical protein
VLNLFPRPNGPDLGRDLAEWGGRNHRPSSLDAVGLRLDHAITTRVTVFARYHESPSLNEFGSTQINRLELRARSVTAGVNARPWAGITFEGRVNTSGARAASMWSQSGPGCELELLTAFYLHREGGCDYLVRLNIAGVGELVSGREGVRKQTQYQAVGGATIERGNHALRLGADYRRLSPSRHEATGMLTVIADSIGDLESSRNPWVAHADPRYGSAVLKELSLLSGHLARHAAPDGGLRDAMGVQSGSNARPQRALPGHGAGRCDARAPAALAAKLQEPRAAGGAGLGARRCGTDGAARGRRHLLRFERQHRHGRD